MRKLPVVLASILIILSGGAFKSPSSLPSTVSNPTGSFFFKKEIKTGADQTDKYLPYLSGKRIGILGNQTSIIGKTHLVDSLKALGVNI
ncbi:MAG TPA: hypothetical protein VF700_05850, partial [Segetibacter sp.]